MIRKISDEVRSKSFCIGYTESKVCSLDIILYLILCISLACMAYQQIDIIKV